VTKGEKVYLTVQLTPPLFLDNILPIKCGKIEDRNEEKYSKMSNPQFRKGEINV
jgi:hypothetical protein